MAKIGFKFNGNISMENNLFEPNETKLVKKILTKVRIVDTGVNILETHNFLFSKKIIKD